MIRPATDRRKMAKSVTQPTDVCQRKLLACQGWSIEAINSEAVSKQWKGR